MTQKNQLDQLRSSIDEWRCSPTSARAMPKELWSAATRIAAELGVGFVAKTLKIDYGKLKRLVGPIASPPVGGLVSLPSLGPPTFLELSVPTFSETLGSASISCQFEVETSQSRLCAQLQNASALDVAIILREFAR